MWYLFYLFLYQGDAIDISWDSYGATPMHQEGYTPQGLTWINDCLIFANSWKNKKSRVYKINPKTMEIEAYFDMPPEAVHTSGLSWDGMYAWAVDYKANRAYKIDIEASFKAQKCTCLGSFSTSLKGTSACCFISYKEKTVLVISDFMHSRKVIAVDQEQCIRDGTTLGNVLAYYRNQGFSQGLTSDGTYLYESENKKPVSVINKIDIEKAFNTHSLAKAIIAQFKTPAPGIEDLAYDGQCFWSSDETTFMFYRTNLKAR